MQISYRMKNISTVFSVINAPTNKQKKIHNTEVRNSSLGGFKVLWCDHNPPLKSGRCGKHITQVNTLKKISKRSESLVTTNIKKSSHKEIHFCICTI